MGSQANAIVRRLGLRFIKLQGGLFCWTYEIKCAGARVGSAL